MDVLEQLRADIAKSKRKRDERIPNWIRNIDERRGKDFDTAADEGRSMVPMDWTLTKTKAAQLFSQTPQIRLTSKHAAYDAAVPVAAKILNDLVKEAAVEAVMFECVVDCVNAAGVAAAIGRFESLTELVPLPSVDPTAIGMASMIDPQAPPIDDAASPVPPTLVTRITDRRFVVDRISPLDLLCPTSFRLSDWNKAPWLGHSVSGPWVKVKKLLNLTDEMKEQVVGAGSRRSSEWLSNDTTQTQAEAVEYDEIFYWRYIYHEEERYYDAIQHVVFVTGLDEPVINEPWKGQRFDQKNGGYLGSCLFPIRVLTVNYISDEAIPPSDSAIIRPQVKELQESRQHMKDQRKHSRPLRWFDVDRVDVNLSGDLIAGTWQGMIPTVGAGDKAIGEVTRSAYPRENLEFDKILKQDIQEAVSIGPNQAGTFASGERSASEAQIVQKSFQTEIALQRARFASFFIGIAEVLFGLWALHGVVEPLGIGAAIGPDAAERLESWDRTRINQKFVADIRVDSTVRLDSRDLIEQLTSVLNVTAQSGFINPKPLIKSILEASGIDPAEVLIDPTPKGPEPPSISYSFKGEDLYNPVVLAIISKTGQGPSPDELEAGKKMAAIMALPIAPPKPPQQVGPGGPAGGPAAPPTDPRVPEKSFPQWESASRINTRRSEG